jgi:hypothetical protein
VKPQLTPGLNIGVHKEAAEHFLAALSLHARDAEKEQRDSTPIWLTLRRALIAMVSRPRITRASHVPLSGAA